MPARMQTGRGTRATTAFLALALIAVSLSVAVAPAATVPGERAPCAQRIFVRGVGVACPRPDGLYDVPLSDGTFVTTHGPDFRSGDPGSRYRNIPGQVKPDCVSDPRTQPHGRVIYAYPSDRPDRYTRMLWNIRAMVYQVNGFLVSEAARFGRRVAYRMLCGGGVLSVARVGLPTRSTAASFGTVVDDVRAAGYTNALEKYWIWYDGPGAAAGTGTFASDSTASSRNMSNFGPSYAVTFGHDLLQGGWFVMMHEGGHNLGNVQFSAPHTSVTAAHCTDGLDVMCYQEPNPNAPRYNPNVCARLAFDCNYNDYFNPNPKPSNYLWDHWNLGSPLDYWVGGCTYRSGTLEVGLHGQSVTGTSSTSITIPRSCGSKRFALSGFSLDAIAAVNEEPPVPNDELVGPQSQVQSAVSRAPQDFNVCFYKGHTRTTCATASGTDTGTIPWGTTSAVITFYQGARGTWIFNAI